MSKEQPLTVDGVITQQFTSEDYEARLENGALVRVYRGGRVRRQRPVPGDQVRLELSPYDLLKGRITRVYPINK